MFSAYKNHLLLHLIIFIWGFTGILGKLIELPALEIVWYRLTIAIVVLVISILIFKKNFRVSSKKRLLEILLIGIVVGLHWLTFYISIQMSTASLGILCLSTATLHVSWIEPIVMKRKFRWIEFLLGLLVVFGVYFISSDLNDNEFIALLTGLSSALFAATFAVFNAKFAEDDDATNITLYEFLSAAAFLSVILIYQGKFNTQLFEMRIEDFLWLLFLGIICTSAAFLIIVNITKKLGAFTVTLSINLEPVYTILLAILILNENELLNYKFYLGALMIIFIVVLNGILKSPKIIKRKAK